MKENNIIERIKKILRYTFEIPYEKLSKGNEDAPLTGSIFNFKALDMTYLFFEVEKEFDCTIDMDKYNLYEFNTIRGIYQIVCNLK